MGANPPLFECEVCRRESAKCYRYAFYYGVLNTASNSSQAGNIVSWRETVSSIQKGTAVVCDDCIWKQKLTDRLHASVLPVILLIIFTVLSSTLSSWFLIGVGFALLFWWSFVKTLTGGFEPERYKVDVGDGLAIKLWKSRLVAQGYNRFYTSDAKARLDRGESVWDHGRGERG